MTRRFGVELLRELCGMHWYGTMHALVTARDLLILPFVLPMHCRCDVDTRT